MVIRRFEIHLVGLDPTIGREMRKTRPCVVISPDEMNRHISTVIITPLTTQGRAYPTRVVCRFQGKKGQVVLDQISSTGAVDLLAAQGRRCVPSTRLTPVGDWPAIFTFLSCGRSGSDPTPGIGDHCPFLSADRGPEPLKRVSPFPRRAASSSPRSTS